jgi:predicted permease
MLAVLTITLPIFLLIALGFAATHLGGVERSEVRALGGFTIKFALPALIFRSLAQRPFAEFASGAYLLVYGGASLAVFTAIFFTTQKIYRHNRAEAAMHGLGASLSNSGFVGYAIVTLSLGPIAAVALAHQKIVENILIIPLAIALAETDGREGHALPQVAAHLARRLAGNPLIIAILTGGAVSLSGFALPGFLTKAIDMLAAASAGVALFAVGGALADLRVKHMIGDIARIVAAKLLVLPAVVFLALRLAPGLDPQLQKAMLIFASAPMFTVFPLIARPYGQEPVAAAALTVATSLSFLTISTLLLAL